MQKSYMRVTRTVSIDGDLVEHVGQIGEYKVFCNKETTALYIVDHFDTVLGAIEGKMEFERIVTNDKENSWT
jgi:hypothetical protein